MGSVTSEQTVFSTAPELWGQTREVEELRLLFLEMPLRQRWNLQQRRDVLDQIDTLMIANLSKNGEGDEDPGAGSITASRSPVRSPTRPFPPLFASECLKRSMAVASSTRLSSRPRSRRKSIVGSAGATSQGEAVTTCRFAFATSRPPRRTQPQPARRETQTR